MSVADPREPIGIATSWLHTSPRRYGFALVAVVLMFFVRYSLGSALGITLPFVLFFPAIVVVALLTGPGPGLFATFLSVVLAKYFFIEPLGSWLKFSHPSDAIRMFLFVSLGILMSAIGGLVQRRAARLLECERAVEGVEEGIIVLDRDYRYVIANRAFLSYRGTSREQVIGRRLPELIGQEAFETTVKPRLDECFRGKVVQYEKKQTYPALGDREFSVSYFPIEGPSGVERVACILKDITLAKRAEESLNEHEAKFRQMADNIQEIFWMVDATTMQAIYVSPAFEQITGRTVASLMEAPLSYREIIHPEDRARVLSKLEEAVRLGVFDEEFRIVRLDGAVLWVAAQGFPVRNPQGEVYRLAGVVQDITERKLAEEALHSSEDRYRDLVEHSEDLLCTHDLDGNLISVNPAPARVLGYPVAELLKISMRELVAPEFRGQFDAYLDRVKDNGADKGLLCVLTRSGERRIWEYHNTLRTEGVAAPIVRGMAHDITERKRAEMALRSSEQRYRTLFEKNIAGVAIAGRDGKVLDCNDAWARVLGYESAEDIRGRDARDFYFDCDDREPLLQELQQAGVVQSRELRLRRKDGAAVWVLFTCVVRQGDGGAPVLQATVIDITERKHAEMALRTSEQRYRSLFEKMVAGVGITSVDGKLVDCNDAWARMFGYGSATECRGTEVGVHYFDPADRQALLAELMQSGTVTNRELHLRRRDGTPLWLLVNDTLLPDSQNPKLIQATVIDITERKQAEEAMRHNEERFRVALKDSPITVFNQDRDLRYTWIYNPCFLQVAEIIGKTDDEILGKKEAEHLNEVKRRVLKTGVTERTEAAVSYEGVRRPYEVTIEPLLDTGGATMGITGTYVDVARLRELADTLQAAKDKLLREKQYLKNEIEEELGQEIIGQSPTLHEVLREARVVAPTDSTVLLLGETGTGKELVARAIHDLSARRDRNFIKLNCAAVPSGLLESELFGHEKGAFTGAVSQKVGRLELADKGTLFLDEIGELPLELQPKLLRVLQDREFERLGGVHTVHVDVRIISATNCDLQQDVSEKNFREDLFYRLNVFPIRLPALRERRSDIPILVRHFVRKHAGRMGKHIDDIPDETMATLQNWSWPGNVRELENLMERMVILTTGRTLEAPPIEMHGPQDAGEDRLTELEREHIIRVLRETHGVLSGIDGAASRLGMKRTTLQSMLKRLRIEPQDYRPKTGTFGRGF